MADTQRTVATLQALLADNASGDISAQDVRDFLATAAKSYGSMHISAPTQTAIIIGNTPVKVAATTTLAIQLKNFTMPATQRLLYTGVPTIHAHVTASMSMTSASNNKTFVFYIALNGAVIDSSKIGILVGGTAIESISLQAELDLSTNDFIEVWVENITDNSNLTVELMNVMVQGIFK